MKRSRLYTLDYSTGFLSAFDISGSLFLNQFVKDKNNDTGQLMKDLDKIESDYKIACDNIMKDQSNERD